MLPSPTLSKISQELSLEHGLNDSQREELVSDYLSFLKQAATADHEIRPTKLVDEIWHRHILDTRSYAEDCDLWFGAFIHHRPCKPGEQDQILLADCGAPQPMPPALQLAECGGSGPGYVM